MIKKITLFALLLLANATFAQLGPVGHLTIFSEDGDKFSLILNGELQNDVPQTNLRIEDLNQPYYNAKIQFADKSLLDISKNNLQITDFEGVFMDNTYKIKRDKNKSGKMKMNFYSAIPVQQGYMAPSNVYVVHHGRPKEVIVIQDNVPVRGGSTQTTTTTTTQNGGVNVGVGVNIGGINMGVSINDSTSGGVVTQTTTTTSSSSSSSVGHDDHSGHDHNNSNNQPRGCRGRNAMSANDFNSALTLLKKQNFEDSRLKTAKQVVDVNCMNVNQIMQIASSFNFEDNTLAFAKYAFDYCVEPKNYFKLNSMLKFTTNADDLSDYVQSRQ